MTLMSNLAIDCSQLDPSVILNPKRLRNSSAHAEPVREAEPP